MSYGLLIMNIYCGKLLVFKKDKSFSMHYHILKDEAWYISKGEFIYKYIDTETASQKNVVVREGDCIHLNARSTPPNDSSY
jgi:mannose-6-phosphate isomerase-like protein (cupin superfamily)